MKALALIPAAVLLAACGSTTAVNDSSETISVPCEEGSIVASGSSAQANAITHWVNKYQIACTDATIDYSPTGSGAGIASFIEGQTAFGGTDKYPKEEEFAAAKCDAAAIPLVAGEVVVIYNIEDLDSLELTKEQVQGIFSNEITKWSEINTNLPDETIVHFHRSDSSGTTANFADYLGWDGGKEWTYPGGQGSKGSDGVFASVETTPNSISYIDLSYSYDTGIKVATLPDKITTITYEMICTSGNDKLTKSFLTYAASEEGQQELILAGYQPVPEDMIEEAREIIEGM